MTNAPIIIVDNLIKSVKALIRKLGGKCENN